jgi:hypothetical protein
MMMTRDNQPLGRLPDDAPGMPLVFSLAILAVSTMLAAPVRGAVTSPSRGESWVTGESREILWQPLPSCVTVEIALLQGDERLCVIDPDAPNDGSYEWTVGGCGAVTGCNFHVAVACGGTTEYSEPFAIDGLMIAEIEPGSRTVQIVWKRASDDTLGAEAAELGGVGDRIFGGYNVWRRVEDNLRAPQLRDRFQRIRTYSVRDFGLTDVSSAWTFARPQVDFNEGTFVAQTFVADDEPTEICRVRLFVGRVFSVWQTQLSVVAAPGGIPDVSDVAGVAAATFGSGGNASGYRWVSYDFVPPAPLAPGGTYALVLTGRSTAPEDARVGWACATGDAFAGGGVSVSDDGGDSWESFPDLDFAFRLGRSAPGDTACFAWLGQVRDGGEDRFFNDPDSILVLNRVVNPDGEEELVRIPAAGPYNAFRMQYAVTRFDRWRASSGNQEFPSACEDTLFDGQGRPLGVQPAAASVWPQAIFSQSETARRAPLLANVYPVPNPYVRDPDSRHWPRWELPGELKLQFVNLPRGAVVKLYTMAGDHVRTLRHTSDHGSLDWDLRNEAGEIVVTGIYIWLVTADNGETKDGQLVVVR